MACYSPLKCFEGKPVDGKRVNVVWKRRESWNGKEIYLPCGQCVGCRMERARCWAMRCMHEASLYSENCFVTLTYDEEHLPEYGSLNVSDWQNFIKRLRKKAKRKLRFFHCGEYGENRLRPHYHGLIFNFGFDDKVPFSEIDGIRTFTSGTLDALWGKGFSLIGEVNFKTAGYVARYCLKKVTGKGLEEEDEFFGLKPYEKITESGEIVKLRPEYSTMSRRPGIGKGWYEKFKGDVFPSDFLVVNGGKCKPPRYYDSQLEIEDPSLFLKIKEERKKEGNKLILENVKGKNVLLSRNNSFLLSVAEKVKLSQISNLKRRIEE